MKEHAEVFCQLRVASKGNGVKHNATIVYNGISANDWLSPIGISPVKPAELEKTDGTTVETLTRRPFTANSIIIIRPDHTKSPKLEKDEALRGQRLQFTCDEEQKCNGKCRFSGICNTSKEFVYKTSDFTSLQNDSRVTMRPATAFGSSNATVRKSARRRGIMKSAGNYRPVSIRSDKNVNLDLTVQSVECDRRNIDSRHTTVPRFSENGVTNHVHFKPTLKIEDYDTIDGLKRSYMKRAQSAPAGALRMKTSNDSCGKKPSLYWRAKSSYHRRVVAREGDQSENSGQDYNDQRGSLLRPLMYSSEGTIKHSAGCPYKCKGCFRACLVSEDYLDKAQQQDRVKSSWRNQRRVKRSPGFSVQLALAKSQPLYQVVHGPKVNSVKEGVKEAWVDDTDDVVEQTQSLAIAEDCE